MDIHTLETAAQHLAKSAIPAMANATLQAYTGSPIPKDDSREHAGTGEDNPAPTLTDTTDPPAYQALEVKDTQSAAHAH